MNKILLILTHYKHNKCINDFILHISSLKIPYTWELEVVICDNSSDFILNSDILLNCTILNPNENKYYLGGSWYAIQEWVSFKEIIPDWIIVANHDLVLSDNFFTELLSISFEDDIGLVAPNVKLPNGVNQNPQILNRPNILSMFLRAAAYTYPLLYVLMHKLYLFKCKINRFF